MGKIKKPFTDKNNPEYEEYMKARHTILSDFPALKEAFPYETGIKGKIGEYYKKNGTEIKEEYISQTLSSYSRKWKYLEKVIKESHRFDMYGNPTVEVSPEDKIHAQKKLEELSKKTKENKDDN